MSGWFLEATAAQCAGSGSLVLMVGAAALLTLAAGMLLGLWAGRPPRLPEGGAFWVDNAPDVPPPGWAEALTDASLTTLRAHARNAERRLAGWVARERANRPHRQVAVRQAARRQAAAAASFARAMDNTWPTAPRGTYGDAAAGAAAQEETARVMADWQRWAAAEEARWV